MKKKIEDFPLNENNPFMETAIESAGNTEKLIRLFSVSEKNHLLIAKTGLFSQLSADGIIILDYIISNIEAGSNTFRLKNEITSPFTKDQFNTKREIKNLLKLNIIIRTDKIDVYTINSNLFNISDWRKLLNSAIKNSN